MGALCDVRRGERRKRAAALISRVGLDHARGRPLRKFSKGMLQRIGIAQALMGDPELVVLDEPMTGLDPIGRKEIRDLMLELKREGRTVLYSTHILPDVELTCDRVAMIFAGRIRSVGPLAELLTASVLSTEICLARGRGVAPALPPGASLRDSPDGMLVDLPAGSDVDGFLRAALAGSCGITAVTPRHESLEDLRAPGGGGSELVMNRIVAIAWNTFREAVRNKILYSLLFFAVLLIVSALAIGNLTLHEEVRTIRDIGLFGIDIFGVIIAIFVGVNLLYKELDLKTVYTILPKPLWRWEFVLGKWLGMLLTLAVQMLVMGLVLGGVLAAEGSHFDVATAKAVWLLFVNVMLVTSMAVFFSAFSSPFLSGFFALGCFVVGRSIPIFAPWGASSDGRDKVGSTSSAPSCPT